MAYAPSGINAEAIRVTEVSATGVPVPGTSGLYVSDNILSAAVTFETEDGTTIRRRKGNGAICLNVQGKTSIVAAKVAWQHCVWPIEATELLLSAKVAFDGADAIGYALPGPEELAQRRFCMEVFSLAYNGSVRTSIDGAAAVGVDIFPNCTAIPDGFSRNNEDAPFGVTVTALPNPNMPDGGPLGEWPHFDSGDILNDNTPQGVHAFFLTTTIPTALEGLQALAAVS